MYYYSFCNLNKTASKTHPHNCDSEKTSSGKHLKRLKSESLCHVVLRDIRGLLAGFTSRYNHHTLHSLSLGGAVNVNSHYLISESRVTWPAWHQSMLHTEEKKKKNTPHHTTLTYTFSCPFFSHYKQGFCRCKRSSGNFSPGSPIDRNNIIIHNNGFSVFGKAQIPLQLKANSDAVESCLLSAINTDLLCANGL